MSPNNSKKKSNKTLFLAIGIIAIIIVGVAAYAMLGQGNQTTNPTTTPTPTPAPSTSPSAATQVLLQTTAGNITLELRSDKPITTANFVNLVKEGLYDGTTFHRVIASFMIQGGENDSANVATIPDEIGSNNSNLRYTVAMAKTSAPNSATSQFFINVVDNGNMVVDNQGTKFDAVYTVFGNVTAGQSVVDAIANAPVTSNAYEQNSTPINPVTVIKATVLP
jgi:cyclophilin family peptidyl-prolyl cis-trans isomerase